MCAQNELPEYYEVIKLPIAINTIEVRAHRPLVPPVLHNCRKTLIYRIEADSLLGQAQPWRVQQPCSGRERLQALGQQRQVVQRPEVSHLRGCRTPAQDRLQLDGQAQPSLPTRWLPSCSYAHPRRRACALWQTHPTRTSSDPKGSPLYPGRCFYRATTASGCSGCNPSCYTCPV